MLHYIALDGVLGGQLPFAPPNSSSFLHPALHSGSPSVSAQRRTVVSSGIWFGLGNGELQQRREEVKRVRLENFTPENTNL